STYCEVRFAPMSRRLGVGPDVRPGVYFPAYFGNSVQATKFQFIINLKAAKALDLTISPSLLRRDPPSGRDLDDGTVSQLLEELAGEMNRPSDRKRRISGYGDRTWRRKADEGWSRSGFRVNHLSTPNSSSAWTACSACFEFEAASGGYTELLHLHGTSF